MKKVVYITCAIICMILAINSFAIVEEDYSRSFFVIDINGNVEDYIISVATLNGELFMLSNQKLYSYNIGEEKINVIVDWNIILDKMDCGQPHEQLLKEFSKTRVDYIFNADSAIYGVNLQYGTIFILEGNEFVPVFLLDVEIARLDEICGNMIKDRNYIYYIIQSFEPEQENCLLCVYDLDSNQIETYNIKSSYLLSNGSEEIGILGKQGVAFFNKKTKEFDNSLVTLKSGVNGIFYSKENNSFVFLQDSKLIYSSENNTYGYINFDSSNSYYEIYQLSTDYITIATSFGIYIRKVYDSEQKGKMVNLCISNKEIIPAFIASNPEIEVIVTDVKQFNEKEIAEQLINGMLQYDVIEVDASTIYKSMASKGYLANLSTDTSILNAHENMYEVIQNAIECNGKIMGVPSLFAVETWAYNDQLWKSMLSDKKIPGTYDEFIRLCNEWINDHIDGEIDYCLIYPNYSFINGIYSDLFYYYISQFDELGNEFSFENETFRNLMSLVKTIEERHRIIQSQEFLSDMQQPLLTSQYFSFFRQDQFSFLGKWTPMNPLALDNQQPSKASARMKLYVINAASNNISEAMQFLEFVVKNRSYADERLLNPNVNTPVERPRFELEYTALQNNIEYLKEKLVMCEENEKRDIEAQLDIQLQLMEQAESNRWLISEEEIAQYREIANYITIRQTPLARIQYESGLNFLYSIFDLYINGRISLDECIERMDSKLNMLLSE